MDKYKKAIFTLSLLLSTLYLFPQIHKTDSIFKLYEKSTEKERIEYIYQLCTSNDIPYPKLNELSLEALRLASETDSKSMVLASYTRAYYHFNSSNYDSVYHYLNQFINGLPNKDNYKIYSSSWILLFSIDITTNEFEKSTKWTDKLLHLSKEFNDSLVKAFYYKACGEREYFLNNNQKGIDYFNKAKNLFEKYNEYNSLAICYMRLSSLFQRTGVVNKATHFISKALELEDSISVLKKSRIYLSLARYNNKNYIDLDRKQLLLKALENAGYLKDYVLTANIYAGIARLYYQNNEIDSALFFFGKSSEFYRIVNDFNNIAINHYNLSLALMDQGEFTEATLYLDSALAIIRGDLKTDDLGAIYLNMAVLYSNQNREQLMSSLYLDSIKQIYPQLSPSLKLEIMDFYIEDYKEKNDFEKALEYYEKRSDLNDSLLKIDFDERIEEVFVKYQTKEKEQENLILKSNIEKEKQKARLNLFAWIGTLFLFVFIAILFFIFRRNTLIRKKLREEEINRKNAQIRQKDEEFKRVEKEKLLVQEKNKSLGLEKDLNKQKLEARNSLLQVTNNSLYQQQRQAEELLKKVKELKPYANTEGKKQIQELLVNLSSSSIDNNWLTFERTFVGLYPNFMHELNTLQPKLSISEKRTCAFIKMKLETAEIKSITFQSRQSIYDLKKRLRRKFGFEDNESLEAFIQTL